MLQSVYFPWLGKWKTHDKQFDRHSAECCIKKHKIILSFPFIYQDSGSPGYWNPSLLKPQFSAFNDWPICEGNPPVIGEFFDRHLNRRFNKQSRRWWFETPSCSLWRHCDVPRKISASRWLKTRGNADSPSQKCYWKIYLWMGMSFFIDTIKNLMTTCLPHPNQFHPALWLIAPHMGNFCWCWAFCNPVHRLNDRYKQRVLMHRHQGWNVRHGLCHIYMRYLYIYELFIAFVCFVVCSLL